MLEYFFKDEEYGIDFVFYGNFKEIQKFFFCIEKSIIVKEMVKKMVKDGKKFCEVYDVVFEEKGGLMKVEFFLLFFCQN